ncbi:cytochrome P450 [Nocardia macrotermitis]|uniref:Polyketide biosynthesis cytochrome P450 PksS n=1 Tax=Nocardia macrotermitis TaxID=2585198 RepID=A0A7K0CVX6_9NOCA|nr:cytochrome P450 [Nocardia macrotermitis]MQY17533.1 Polyketide biosynthesis cytochrome P450 PksS [Nocardia macrotermitis]
MPFDTRTFSFSNTDLVVDPYPAYAQIREREPIHYSTMYGGSWLLFSYEDAVALLRDPRLTNNRATLPIKALPEHQRGEFDEFVAFLHTWTAFREGEQHTMRRARLNSVFRALTPTRVTEVAQQVTDRLIDSWEGREKVDLVKDFARPLPAMMLTSLIGAPQHDHAQLDHWSDQLAYLFGTSALTAEDVRRAWDGAQELMTYLEALAAELTGPGNHGMLGELLTTGGPGYDFSVAEACAQCVLMLFAGIEPSRHLIGNAMMALHRFPDQRGLLRNDPRLWPAAIEEFMRFDPPVQYIGRLAAESFDYRGHRIERGQPVLPYIGSANRDPKQFVDPDILDIRRRGRHLSFSEGVHRCIGAGLVRTQTTVALRTLLTRIPDLEVCTDPAPHWNAYVGFHGLQSLTVSVPNITPAAMTTAR